MARVRAPERWRRSLGIFHGRRLMTTSSDAPTARAIRGIVAGKERTMSYVEPDRRQVLRGLAAGAPLAAILSDPELARAAASALEDVSLQTSEGRSVHASLALPAHTPAPAVLLIHEWWGLDDQIKSVAGELAREGYAALAIDLYEGKLAGSP